jgi:hypothetical protein
MSNNRYLEIDSTYRDRNKWPLASQFEVPISQTGRKSASNAIDPVSLSTPIFSWTSNYLNINSTPPSYSQQISGVIFFPPLGTSPSPSITSSDLSTFIIYFNSPITPISGPPGPAFQQLQNYYIGLSITITIDSPPGTVSAYVTRRISNFTYLGPFTQLTGANNDSAEITVTAPFPDSFFSAPSNVSYTWTINDPTTVLNPSYPQFFVPAGRIQKNAYTSYLLYNETQQQSRPVSAYDPITHMVSVDTSGSASSSNGPVSGWTRYDNYSIRKQIPLITSTNQTYLNSTIYVISYGTTNNNSLSNVSGTYNNLFIRTIPSAPTIILTPPTIPLTLQQYEYILPPSTYSGNYSNNIYQIRTYVTFDVSYGQDTFTISEQGYQPRIVTVNSGNYSTGSSLASAIAVALNTGSPFLAGNYIVGYVSSPTYQFTITSFTGSQFTIIFNNYLYQQLGFSSNTSYISNIGANPVHLAAYALLSVNLATGCIINYNTISTISPIQSSTIFPVFEILPFSFDNLNPFTYTGSLVSQQEMVCYEVELLNLIVPNETLNVGEGGRIAFYPYIYVQLSNAEARLSNIIYSNNPNSTKALFRVPIDDVVNPLISTFLNLDGDGMVQTIKFKPNDNLFFSVFLSNGELYDTLIKETYSPAPTNPACQISASFSIRRL